MNQLANISLFESLSPSNSVSVFNEMKWFDCGDNVKNTTLYRYGYDEEEGIFEVEYATDKAGKNKKRIQFFNVEPIVFQKFQEAPNKVYAFTGFIQYDYKKQEREGVAGYETDDSPYPDYSHQIPMTEISTPEIVGVGYDNANKLLDVDYGRSVYRYFGIDPEDYTDLMTAYDGTPQEQDIIPQVDPETGFDVETGKEPRPRSLFYDKFYKGIRDKTKGEIKLERGKEKPVNHLYRKILSRLVDEDND